MQGREQKIRSGILSKWPSHYCLINFYKRCVSSNFLGLQALLRTEEKQEWLGKLSQKEHYEALIEWACNIVENKYNTEIPEKLLHHRFQRFQEVVIRD